ncbi:MAG: dipeptide epimerase [Alphaproteobacteria bacterium]|nr:MAG: dipeptide epimerase [Alphaproteobacteria bacterium]
MNITKIDIHKLNIAISIPIRTKLGIIDSASNVVVKITTESGIYGWGEASPFAPITGDSQDSSYSAAQQMALLIKDKDALAVEARMAEINCVSVGEPSIRSAFDMALYDIAAKAAGMPLYRFLGGERREIRTDLTIGWWDTVEDTVAQARNILDAGFDAIKLKVGRPGLQDVAHVAAVRELAGPDIALKIDSNQGWDYPTAVANINAMAHLDLEYSEQPLAVWDYDNMARLRDKVDLPICADESVFDHHDALKLVRLGAADYLNIKLGKAGGIHMGLKINAIAEAAGAKCMIGCFAESRLGLSAAAHLAMARPNIAFIDLDSCYHFKSDPVIGGVTFDDKIGGLLHLPDTPGHGAEIDVSTLDPENSIQIDR